MALYKYGQHLTKSEDGAFDAKHAPGVAASHAGVYICAGCGHEIGIAEGHKLPPQDHHQHANATKIEWQLLVYAQHQK